MTSNAFTSTGALAKSLRSMDSLNRTSIARIHGLALRDKEIPLIDGAPLLGAWAADVTNGRTKARSADYMSRNGLAEK